MGENMEVRKIKALRRVNDHPKASAINPNGDTGLFLGLSSEEGKWLEQVGDCDLTNSSWRRPNWSHEGPTPASWLKPQDSRPVILGVRRIEGQRNRSRPLGHHWPRSEKPPRADKEDQAGNTGDQEPRQVRTFQKDINTKQQLWDESLSWIHNMDLRATCCRGCHLGVMWALGPNEGASEA